MIRQAFIVVLSLVVGLIAGFIYAKHLQTREIGGVGDAQVRAMLSYTTLLRPFNGAPADEALIRARIARSTAVHLRGAAYHYPEILLDQNRQSLLKASKAVLSEGLIDDVQEPEYRDFVLATARCLTAHPEDLVAVEACLGRIPNPYAEQMKPAGTPPP